MGDHRQNLSRIEAVGAVFWQGIAPNISTIGFSHSIDPERTLEGAGIDRAPPHRASERGQGCAGTFELHKPVDSRKQMILGDMSLQRELVDERALIDPPLAASSPRAPAHLSRSESAHAADYRFNRGFIISVSQEMVQ
ncbi:MAG TPA: hypothetical protein VIJ94_00130 [Caulobacteraceae bacterium]